VDCAPGRFRSEVKKEADRLVTICQKWHKVSCTLADLLQHQVNSTFPSPLAGQKPTFQVTKEYEAECRAPTFPDNWVTLTSLDGCYREFRVSYLGREISIKTQELEILTNLTKPEVYLPPIVTAVTQIEKERARTEKIPTVRHGPAGPEVRYELHAYDGVAMTRYITDIANVLGRVVELTKLSLLKEKEKTDAKKKVKETVDVVMGEASGSGKSQRDLVKEEVKRALAAASKGKKPQASGSALKGKSKRAQGKKTPAQEKKKQSGSGQKKDPKKDKGKGKAK